MLQTPHPRRTSLDPLQELPVSPALGGPALDTALQVEPQQGSAEGAPGSPADTLGAFVPATDTTAAGQ